MSLLGKIYLGYARDMTVTTSCLSLGNQGQLRLSASKHKI